MMKQTQPGYVTLLKTGELHRRAEQLKTLFSPCRLCPWGCGVNRPADERGHCRASSRLQVARALPHFGEEPAISGCRGSGTIFFSNCNLRCCYCQNFQISQNARGESITVDDLSRMMLNLQHRGCHNINLVSASHFLPLIIQALCKATAEGLTLPLVYNSNGYEDVRVLQLLRGIIDIYLPDAKYSTAEKAERYSGAPNYPEINDAALQEMFQQVGYLKTDAAGHAERGLIVRHLVLPGNLSGTAEVLSRLKHQFGRFLTVSLMGQYRPCHQAGTCPELTQALSRNNYAQAIARLEELNFENAWVQDHAKLDMNFIPDFEKTDSWN
ncbi:MAG: radical SAM protein [Deltaproteobacteria bacterium]|nr:radical SAM protein [Deltaproteobacteria bacterium]